MDIEEIRRRIVEFRNAIVPRSLTDRFCGELLELIDAVEEDPPVDVDDGFVILPVPRYEALREAEEHLQETRFAPSDGEQDRVDALTRLVDQIEAENDRLRAEVGRIKGAAKEEIRHLREAAKVRADAAAPPRVADAVLLKHIQDLRAEIDAIKDRTNRTDMTATRTYNDIYDRLDATDKAVGEKLGTIFDRLGAFAGRMNQLKAREVTSAP